MTRFEAYKGGLFKADLAEGVWIYFHSSPLEIESQHQSSLLTTSSLPSTNWDDYQFKLSLIHI